jgi:Ca-activated chloride channel family protein
VRRLRLLLILLLCFAPNIEWDLHAQPNQETRKLSRRERKDRIARLADPYREFLQLVEPITTPEELNLFLLMESDAQRDRFIEDFWRRRDSDPKTARNEYREGYLARYDEARRLFRSANSERGRIYLVSGEPAERLEVERCDLIRPVEIWRYGQHHALGRNALLLFYDRSPGAGDYRLWYPEGLIRESLAELLLPNSASAVASRLPPRCPVDPVQALFYGGSCPNGVIFRPLIQTCPHGSVILQAVRETEMDRGGARIQKAFVAPPPRTEDIARVLRTSVIANPDAAKLKGEISTKFRGAHGERTAVEITIMIPSQALKPASLAGQSIFNLDLTGETLKDDAVFEAYQYRFSFPASSGSLPLTIERSLYPGAYQARIKVVDANSGAEAIFEATLEVPRLNSTTGKPSAPAVAPVATKLRILPPETDSIVVGFVRVDTIVADPSIRTVEFYLDGKKLMTKRNPPFGANLDFGPVPRTRTVRAVALNEKGESVDVDERTVNVGADPFRIRILSPRPGATVRGRVRVEVEAQVPEGKAVRHLEIFVNDLKMATLFGPPYVQTVSVDPSGITTIRAVATAADDTLAPAEDLVFLNTPEFMEHIQVRLIELPVTILRDGRPVEDLPREAFRVFDQDKPVAIERFEHLRDLPLSLGLAIDTSGSMRDRLLQAQRAGAEFFQKVLKPGDQAFILGFDRQAQMLRPWSREPAELIMALSSIRAEEMTALYDAIISALYQFQGVRGQRALVLISDGRDTASNFSWDQALEYSKRAGVPLYVIGLGISGISIDVRPRLAQLAAETGGTAFFINDPTELGSIYRQIEAELRSQYLLAFYPAADVKSGGEWRSIRVQVEGANAKTIRGYYP